MRDGVRIINCARGELIDLDALLARARVGQGRRRRARRLPVGAVHRASAVRARRRGRHAAPGRLDRRGAGPGRDRHRRAGQGGAHRRAWSPTPSTSPPCAPRRWRRWRRSCPSASGSAAWPRGSATGRIDRVEVDFHGRIAEHDTRLLGIAVLVGILSGHTEEPVNLVNAPAMAEDRGIELIEVKEAASEDFTELIRVRLGGVEVAGTGVGPRNVPYLVGAWGQSFYMPFADHLAVFRYADQPGMIGRVGTAFGEHGVNIVSAAVGAGADGEEAVMALTTDAPVARRGDRRDRLRQRLLRRPQRRPLSRAQAPGSRRPQQPLAIAVEVGPRSSPRSPPGARLERLGARRGATTPIPKSAAIVSDGEVRAGRAQLDDRLVDLAAPRPAAPSRRSRGSPTRGSAGCSRGRGSRRRRRDARGRARRRAADCADEWSPSMKITSKVAASARRARIEEAVAACVRIRTRARARSRAVRRAADRHGLAGAGRPARRPRRTDAADACARAREHVQTRRRRARRVRRAPISR